jgi:hypothetical protein
MSLRKRLRSSVDDLIGPDYRPEFLERIQVWAKEQGIRYPSSNPVVNALIVEQFEKSEGSAEKKGPERGLFTSNGDLCVSLEPWAVL